MKKFILIALCLALSLFCFGGEDKPKVEKAEAAKEVNFESAKTSAEIELAYNKKVDQLIAIIKDNKKLEGKEQFAHTKAVIEAVKSLGMLRAEKAVPILFAKLGSIPVVFGVRDIDVAYPCLSALIEIGKPVLLHGIKELETEENDVRRRLILQLLHNIEGVVNTNYLLNRQLVKTKSKQAKINLNKALHELKKISFTFRYNRCEILIIIKMICVAH